MFLKRLAHICVFMLALVCGMVQAKADNKPLKGIVGPDNREVVSGSSDTFRAIGHINVTGFRSKRRCTGTLIAPDRVVTAAHCLVRKRTGEQVPLSHIHFVAGVRGGDFQDHAKAKCVLLAKTPYKPVDKLSRGLLADMAVVVLDKELGITPLPLLNEVEVRRDTPLAHASYPRDSRYALFADFGCRLRGRKYGLWLTDCDTNFASSGGPVLIRADQHYRLGAVMAGFVKDKFTIAVPLSAWRSLLLDRACP